MSDSWADQRHKTALLNRHPLEKQERSMSMLKELLEAVRDGQLSFRPASSSPEDMAAFQPVAKALAFAHDEGYLERCSLHREHRSGNNWYDSVLVQGGLSHKGDGFLTSPAHEPEQCLEEILELRPNIFGIGLNLRALLKRCRGE